MFNIVSYAVKTIQQFANVSIHVMILILKMTEKCGNTETEHNAPTILTIQLLVPA